MQSQFVRPPAVAGTFYPSNSHELSNLIQHYFSQTKNEHKSVHGQPKALICPHAGYIYSGPVAATAYGLLKPYKDRIKKVVLLGPGHRLPIEGLALSHYEAFNTPLGSIPIDLKMVEKIKKFPQVAYSDAAHSQEHSLEVHLPFLQTVLAEFSLLPLVVGDASPEEVATVLQAVWGGNETLIVISSDLSHYLPYTQAQKIDQLTSQAIEKLRYQEISYDQACGRIPIQGLLVEAKRLGLKGSILDLRNSGDTSGSKDQVVGYGAYAFSQP